MHWVLACASQVVRERVARVDCRDPAEDTGRVARGRVRGDRPAGCTVRVARAWSRMRPNPSQIPASRVRIFSWSGAGGKGLEPDAVGQLAADGADRRLAPSRCGVGRCSRTSAVGRAAAALEALTDDEVLRRGMAELRVIFGALVPEPLEFLVTRWVGGWMGG